VWTGLRDEGGLGVRGEVRDVVRGALQRIRLREEVRASSERNVPSNPCQS